MLRCEAGDYGYHTPCLVTAQANELILGLNWLESRKAQWNQDRWIMIRGHRLPVLRGRNRKPCHRIQLNPSMPDSGDARDAERSSRSPSGYRKQEEGDSTRDTSNAAAAMADAGTESRPPLTTEEGVKEIASGATRPGTESTSIADGELQVPDYLEGRSYVGQGAPRDYLQIKRGIVLRPETDQANRSTTCSAGDLATRTIRESWEQPRRITTPIQVTTCHPQTPTWPAHRSLQPRPPSGRKA